MSRSGYSDGTDEWAMIRWRGAVAAGIATIALLFVLAQ
jgi:hypothetical protein